MARVRKENWNRSGSKKNNSTNSSIVNQLFPFPTVMLSFARHHLFVREVLPFPLNSRKAFVHNFIALILFEYDEGECWTGELLCCFNSVPILRFHLLANISRPRHPPHTKAAPTIIERNKQQTHSASNNFSKSKRNYQNKQEHTWNWVRNVAAFKIAYNKHLVAARGFQTGTVPILWYTNMIATQRLPMGTRWRVPILYPLPLCCKTPCDKTQRDRDFWFRHGISTGLSVVVAPALPERAPGRPKFPPPAARCTVLLYVYIIYTIHSFFCVAAKPFSIVTFLLSFFPLLLRPSNTTRFDIEKKW